MAKKRSQPGRPPPIPARPAHADVPAEPPLLSGPAPRGDVLARIFFFAALLGLALVVLQLFAAYVTDIVMAVLFASLLGPLHRWLVVRLKVEWLAAAVGCVVVAAVIVGPVLFLVVTLSREAADAVAAARTSVSMDAVNAYLFGDGWLATRAKNLSGSLGVPFTPDSVKGAVMGAVGSVAAFLYERTNALVGNFLVFLFHLGITFLALFYLLVDGHRFRKFLLETSPLPDDEDELIIRRFQSVGRAIIFGNGVGSVAQGVVGAIAMAAVGFESPVMWGTVMAFAAFLPMIGISIVTFPAAIYLFTHDRAGAAIVFLAVTISLSFVFENVVKTKLIGSQVRMHDFVILLSILAGMSMFGLMGLLYGPMVVALFLVLLELYQVRYRPQLVAAAQRA